LEKTGKKLPNIGTGCAGFQRFAVFEHPIFPMLGKIVGEGSAFFQGLEKVSKP